MMCAVFFSVHLGGYMKRKKLITSNSMTFQEGFTQFIYSCKVRNLREGTIKHYEEGYRSIIRYFDKDIPIESINKSTVDNFVLKCKDNPSIGEQTLYTYLRDLKTILRFYMKNGYLNRFDIPLTKVNKTPIETYSELEIKQLLKKPNLKQCSFVEYRDYCIVCMLLSSGIRLSSLINIRIKDIDFENAVAYIQHTKNRKVLIIPLNASILKVLKEWIKQRQHKSKDDFLFCNIYGNQLKKSTIIQSMTEYNKSKGIEKTGIHRFRHTFAKQWILNGGNVVTLSKMLGHSGLDITQNYINMLVSDIKREVDKLDIIATYQSEYIKLNHKRK